MKDSFGTCHPLVTFTYFSAVILLSMLLSHPFPLVFSFFCPFLYSLMLRGRKALRFIVLFLLPLMAAAVLLNPLFNHAGATILAYLPDGNPMTLESVCYGAAAACMFGSVLLWFFCFHEVMTSDKLICLFGGVFPSQSLLLSMALRFVPRYQAQIRVISRAQACIGHDGSGGIFRKAKNGMRILSVMTTWALENAIETADSMRARGYGLPGRTSFSVFRFDGRDRAVFFLLLLLIAGTIWGFAAGEHVMRFFPSLRLPGMTATGSASRLAYAALCSLPLIFNCAEALKWTLIKSRL